jgi:hypothetical protein
MLALLKKCGNGDDKAFEVLERSLSPMCKEIVLKVFEKLAYRVTFENRKLIKNKEWNASIITDEELSEFLKNLEQEIEMSNS